MDEQPTGGSDDCVRERFKGNLRIRVHRYFTNAGSVSHMIEVVAWNSWASQGKLVLATGGLNRALAEALFFEFATSFVRYDWERGGIVLEVEQ